ncbi:hypothetical protein KP509_1Z302400 [Ceratopteris richardii]|nr:hypothetical protein KP509_1Z302400 [Ceratopteris richardii]
MSSPGVMALRQVGFEELNHGGSFLTSPTNSKDLISSTKVKGIRYKASVTDAPVKVRKPYTITKQREKWTEDEHKKFLDALKLHGRAWRRIEEHIGTKTAVQIRSHAQKFFSKLEREASLGGSFTAAATREIEIPPPRPKRKPTHPYPKKACATVLNSSSMEEDSKSPQAVQSAFTPLRKGSTTDLNYLGKKLGSSAASLRLFGQTMIQGVEAQEVDTEVIESTGSPRSQVSMDTEETSTVSPVTGHRPLANQIGLSSSFNELAFMQDKSQLIDTDSGWENSPFSVQGTQFMGPPYLTHQMAAFQQGFMSPTFFHATNDDGKHS